ncbi:GNAT family N-acetyltransferase [Cellulomonas sp. DKR-3]|uniref:GNAT family N-acetyltransferase n=1 Tax=Cellulomonas fulva TaxID=2835530 RepID=A0ABS5TWQ2_9CELL|nr:GNAT family N-acetyltransferase [Cellulomonas fulva]MBT0993531.1 GNAT family N-acetyltransferase [Cellulomonas fulva]
MTSAPLDPAGLDRVHAAGLDDVPAVQAFGEQHVPPHYTPLVGAEAAAEQVRRWWGREYLTRAAAAGQLVLASSDGSLVGVAQSGARDGDAVVYKLYVHPGWRGRGVGRLLLGALVDRLPPGADRLWVEHVAANERAGAFYEREGFVVDRVDAGATGDPARAQVWRVRPVAAPAPRTGRPD